MIITQVMYVLVLFLGYPNSDRHGQEASYALRAFETAQACESARTALLRGENPGSKNDHIKCMHETISITNEVPK